MGDKNLIKEVMLFFSELYKEPNSECLNVTIRSGFESDLSRGLDIPRGEIKITKFKSLEDMKSQFNELFINKKKLYAPAVESFYKPWTLDPTSSLPLAKNKCFFMGDSAWHIQSILEQLNIERTAEFNTMPDHISVILELAAILVEDEAQFLIFIENHLDWLDEFILQMKAVTESSFYIDITQVLHNFVKKTIEERRSVLK